MLERFRMWYLDNAVQLTWFIIGAMIMSGLIYFGQGQWLNAILCWAIAAGNYWFRNK